MQYFWPKQPDIEITVAAAESVTVGALSSVICGSPGAMKFFKGGIIAYSPASKKELLGIDTEYAELNNFANPFTTSEMARAVARKFGARIGLSTTGYSLPIQRAATDEQCALDIKTPYAYIALYDCCTAHEVIKRFEYVYDEAQSRGMNRATVQSLVALEGKKMLDAYIETITIMEEFEI